jgi:anti-sigma regulatory factor (Ser/Thr protein kinase)
VSPNPRYRPPVEVLASTPAPPAPVLGPPSKEQPFANGTTALRGIRAWTRRHGLEAGFDLARVDGLVLAVCELVSNSIEHGAGYGTLSWWIRPGRVVAQIHDTGQMSTTTPGLCRPAVRSARGRGVWLARQLSDVLHLWTTVEGTYARLK